MRGEVQNSTFRNIVKERFFSNITKFNLLCRREDQAMVSVENYECSCSTNGLKRFTSKAGKGYVKCGTEDCTLFSLEEKYLEMMETYNNKVFKIQAK